MISFYAAKEAKEMESGRQKTKDKIQNLPSIFGVLFSSLEFQAVSYCGVYKVRKGVPGSHEHPPCKAVSLASRCSSTFSLSQHSHYTALTALTASSGQQTQ